MYGLWNSEDMLNATHTKIATQFHTWLDCFTVLTLSATSCLLTTLWKNGWMNFNEIFIWGINWNILMMLRLTFWIRFFNFIFWIRVRQQHYGGWMDFHEIFSICRTLRKIQLARLFHAWMNCFTILNLGAAGLCALRMVFVIGVNVFCLHGKAVIFVNIVLCV